MLKKQILTIILTATIFNSFAHDKPANDKAYKNEFGVDATSFLKQFLNFNIGQQSQTYYSPTYYITYRRHFKAGNIRFAIGGSFGSQDIPTTFPQDQNKYHSNYYSYDARIGWEFVSDLSKRWQVFYGLDFRPSYSYSKNDANYWNGGYANGSESKGQILGVAPLLGFRFRLMNRLSLTTETSLTVNWQKSSSRQYYTPVTNQYPAQPDLVTPETKRVYSNFNQPISVILTFDL